MQLTRRQRTAAQYADLTFWENVDRQLDNDVKRVQAGHHCKPLVPRSKRNRGRMYMSHRLYRRSNTCS